jgi:bacteriocin biosynthesis cyclodehydratase domain-containing protein
MLRALPVQLAETSDGVVLKRGSSILKIDGEGAAEVVTVLLERAQEPRTREQLREGFAPRDQAAVEDLVDRLVQRRILIIWDRDFVPAAPDGLDIFYWNFGARSKLVAERLAAARLTVLGINEVSHSLVAALVAGGVTEFTVVDYHLLRNVSFFDGAAELRTDRWAESSRPPVPYRAWADQMQGDEPRFVVATSDFGATPAIRQWNQFCVSNGWGLLPVILQDLIGYVGPLVIPGETACYECLRARQNSHMADPAAQRAPETRGFEDQRLTGFHPSMARVVGELAAMELLKFHGNLPMWRVGTMIEMNLMAPSLAVRRVLKVPRCAVCSPTQMRASTTLDIRVYNLTYDE